MKTKLTDAQQELLDAMNRGVIVHEMSGMDSYYFRADNFKRCSATARALIEKGLAEKYDESWRGSKVRAKK